MRAGHRLVQGGGSGGAPFVSPARKCWQSGGTRKESCARATASSKAGAPEERHSLAQRVSAGGAWPMKTSPGGAALNRIRISDRTKPCISATTSQTPLQNFASDDAEPDCEYIASQFRRSMD